MEYHLLLFRLVVLAAVVIRGNSQSPSPGLCPPLHTCPILEPGCIIYLFDVSCENCETGVFDELPVQLNCRLSLYLYRSWILSLSYIFMVIIDCFLSIANWNVWIQFYLKLPTSALFQCIYSYDLFS